MDLANFEHWNKEIEKVKEQNQSVFDDYKTWLSSQYITEDEEIQYLADITFFAQTFLILNEAIPVEKGINHIDEYLGHFFIREVPWSSPETIKSNTQSFLNFYSFLLSTQQIEEKDFLYIEYLVGSETDKWINNYHLFNSSCEF